MKRARSVSSRGPRLRLRRTAAGLVCGLATVLVASCSPEAPKLAGTRPPIVLISIDTLRSDHLPAYGYTAGATPAIDALAADGVVFSRAYAPAPQTGPSHASILSGLDPNRHGLRDNIGYPYDAPRLPHLPRLLHEAGYATAGAVSAFVLRGEVGFAHGFDLYEDRIATRVSSDFAGIQRRGQETLDAVMPWLERNARGEKPFFLFLHLYEPHAPYTPPEPYRSRFALAYDGEIATADAVVGNLMAALRRLEVYDRAAIVLLSDHGEGFGEKEGEHGHGVFLYRYALQVPLLLKLPQRGHAGTRVDSVVRLIDVAPTLEELAGAPDPGNERGNSLLSLLAGAVADRPAYAESWAPRLHFGWSELHSLVDGRLHYIHGPDPELYDLAADPGELVNLRAAERREYARLRAALEPRISAPAAPQQEDEETRRKLAALGYLGSASAPAGATLPDPKVAFHTLADFQNGMDLFEHKRFREAADLLRRAVGFNPYLVDGWDYLGRSLLELGRPAEALEPFKKSIALSGRIAETALFAARTLTLLDRVEEALLVLERQIASSPDDIRLRYMKVRICLESKRFADAEREARAALAVAPERADSAYQLASVLMAENRLDEAETRFRQALTLDPEHTATLSDLAVLLASRRRFAEAVELLERLIRLRPGDALAARNLARIQHAAATAQ